MSGPIQLARQSLLAYAIASNPNYKPGWHHRKTAAALEAVVEGRIKRLIIEEPPRHGKSLLASRYLPPWALGRLPGKKFIFSTYSQDFAEEWGEKVREEFLSDTYKAVFPEVRLKTSTMTRSRLELEGDGAYYASGAGGILTGRGGNIVLIDDPIKNREQADSEVERKILKDWYTSTLYTRLHPDAAIIIIQTRWHQDDLIGFVLREHAHENWTVIDFPALDRETETKALWPAFYPVEALNKIRKTIGPRDWSALYMQTPTAAGGGEFLKEWVSYYDQIDWHRMNRYIITDPANEKKKRSDYTSMWCIGLHEDGNYYVIDFLRDRFDLKQRTEKLFEWRRTYMPSGVGYEKVSMQADIQHVQSEQEHKNYRFHITPLEPANINKKERIRGLIPLFAQRKVIFPRQKYYTGTHGRVEDMVKVFIEEEYASFDACLHDDMLDGLSWIARPDLRMVFPAQREQEAILYDDTGIL